MSKKPDHRKEALSILKVQDGNLSALASKGRIAMAQVHATLYVAEQLRIANLLTCWEMYGKERTFASPQRDDDLPAEIREGLGI